MLVFFFKTYSISILPRPSTGEISVNCYNRFETEYNKLCEQNKRPLDVYGIALINV